MSQDDITNLLCDLRDIRNALSADTLNQPKDNEGTEFTIGDLLDDAIAMLETNLPETN